MSKETNKTEEMSTLDELIPRYYKGYDMDDLIGRMRNQKHLTEEEWKVIGEAQDIYHGMHFEKVHKEIEEWKKANPGYKIHRNIQFIPNTGE